MVQISVKWVLLVMAVKYSFNILSSLLVCHMLLSIRGFSPTFFSELFLYHFWPLNPMVPTDFWKNVPKVDFWGPGSKWGPKRGQNSYFIWNWCWKAQNFHYIIFIRKKFNGFIVFIADKKFWPILGQPRGQTGVKMVKNVPLAGNWYPNVKNLHGNRFSCSELNTATICC